MNSNLEQPAQEVLAGLVERVTFHNGENGFCVLRAKARGHRDLVTVVGHAAIISAGEWITASGEWINDRAHGQQFKARFLKTSTPSSIDGIEKYLGSGMIRGIGPGYAKKMIKAFGEKVFDVIGAEPDRLREVTGIGAVRAKRITDAWAEQKIVREIMVFLTVMGSEPPGQFASSRPTGPTLRTVVRDLLDQAEERQKTTQKLDRALGPGKFEHNSYSTSDQQSGRSGDFFLGDVAIHVTTSPGEAVIERCRDNLNDGFRPLPVTGQRGVTVAEGLAGNAGLADRIDVFEVEQFIALNLYELGKFVADGRRVAVSDFVTRYNEIIDDVETDPSLKIEFRP
jgi:hypothetical protein